MLAVGVVARRHRLTPLLAHGFAAENQAVGVMDQSVEDRVGERRVAQVAMPVIDRQRTGDQRGAALVAIVEDVEQIAHGLMGERREAEIIEEQQVDAGELLEQARALLQCLGGGSSSTRRESLRVTPLRLSSVSIRAKSGAG